VNILKLKLCIFLLLRLIFTVVKVLFCVFDFNFI